MTLALLIGLFAVIFAFLVLLDRRDERAVRERAADREELQVLLQRIQAPHAAVHEHHGAVTAPEPVQASSLPMSDEEVADLQNRHAPDGASELARIIAQMEAVENGSAQLEDGVLP